MIVDVDITYRADFVPKRARNVRKGCASDTIALEVREVSASDAPAVLEVGHSNWIKTVRTIDGLLYMPMIPLDGRVRPVAQDVAALVKDRMVGTALVPGYEREIHRLPGDAGRVSTQRDPVVAHLTEWLAENAVLVDGVLHRRVVSPLIPVRHFVEAFGKGAEIVTERTGNRFVPAWFPPRIDGQRLMTVMNTLPKRPAMRGEAKSWYLNVAGRMDARVLDEGLYAVVSRDPRNVNLSTLAEEAMTTFKEAGPKIGEAYPGALIQLPHLLEAVAETKAAVGTDVADIEERLEEIASHSTARPSSRRQDVPDGRLASLRLFVDDSPILATAENPWGLRKLGSDQPPLFFPTSDLTRAMDLAVMGAGRHRIEHKPVMSEAPEAVGFDVDGWNLRVAMAHVVGKADARIRLLPKSVVDAMAEVSMHLRDWRADTKSAMEPGMHEAFVRNAAVVVDAMDGFELEDVGDPWFRTIAKECCAAATAATAPEPAHVDDPELRGFAF